jgi:hypothetical protein
MGYAGEYCKSAEQKTKKLNLQKGFCKLNKSQYINKKNFKYG